MGARQPAVGECRQAGASVHSSPDSSPGAGTAAATAAAKERAPPPSDMPGMLPPKGGGGEPARRAVMGLGGTATRPNGVRSEMMSASACVCVRMEVDQLTAQCSANANLSKQQAAPAGAHQAPPRPAWCCSGLPSSSAPCRAGSPEKRGVSGNRGGASCGCQQGSSGAQQRRRCAHGRLPPGPAAGLVPQRASPAVHAGAVSGVPAPPSRPSGRGGS